ncbi:MAG: succinylglutamate desuccinylase/aspartoacylase family protein [Saprospiraceae bacterium]|nr:succinylglutamate desuccinylase/aspartoacylase family protein [Saprospiraceae bacterium]
MLQTGDANPVIRKLDLASLPKEAITRLWIHLVTDALGQPVCAPVVVARGAHPGPVLGMTAAVHGNEINGIPVIQRMFADLDVSNLRGTLVGVLVVNVPSFLNETRRFVDGTDLNHIMPGKAHGNVSEIYAYRFVNNVIRHLDYLADLHTASFGRINSYYIRADLRNASTAEMARVQNADIIVHNPPSDGTLRGAAAELGIPAITLEVGDPHTFQRGMIRSSLTGINNLLAVLGMTGEEVEAPASPPVVCSDSHWIYAGMGGILRVMPDITDHLIEGQEIARLQNIFGEELDTYRAPHAGIVIGKSVSPVCQTGDRILHLGTIDQEQAYPI